MVKNKKALILLLVFLAFFNRSAYSKDKRVKYLPSNQDVQIASKDYKSGELIKGDLVCAVCSDISNKAFRCDNCVSLREDCPDCCLTAAAPKAIKCSPNDTTDDYDCGSFPFRPNACKQVECDYTAADDSCANCGSRERDDNATDSCNNVDNKNTPVNENYLTCNADGTVASGSPYGLQRRGCPDEFSDELAPAGCSGCTITGTGKNRVWTCPKASSCTPNSSPSFQTCSANSGPPRCDSLTSYYDIAYVWAYTTSCTTTQSCNAQCYPTCTPATPSCSSSLSSCASTTCTQSQNCPIPCTPPPCPPLPSPLPPPPWMPPPCPTCTPTPCTATATCTTTPYIQSYIYSLNSTFKTCIDTCTAYADDYEKCRDRVKCCERAVCESGYRKNCKDSQCKTRLTVSPPCYNSTAGDCARLHQLSEECLTGNIGTCFKEIDRNLYYDFVAKTGESYNIVWQINTTPLNDAKESSDKFYTMIKVIDPTFGTTLYNSALHQKSLNAAFSIYGTTIVSKDTLPNLYLMPGKRYQVRVYYFMNENINDPATAENEATDYQVEINHMSLIVTKVRE